LQVALEVEKNKAKVADMLGLGTENKLLVVVEVKFALHSAAACRLLYRYPNKEVWTLLKCTLQSGHTNWWVRGIVRLFDLMID
jgi:hypothetical protein